MEPIIDTGPLNIGKVKAVWKITLAGILCAQLGVRFYISGKGLNLVGRESQVKQLRGLHAMLVEAVEEACEASGATGKTGRNDFRVKAVELIREESLRAAEDELQLARKWAKNHAELAAVELESRTRGHDVDAWMRKNLKKRIRSVTVERTNYAPVSA